MHPCRIFIVHFDTSSAMSTRHCPLSGGPRVSRLYTAVPVHAGDRWLLTLFGHSFAQALEVHEYTFRITAVQSYTHPPKKKECYKQDVGPRWLRHELERLPNTTAIKNYNCAMPMVCLINSNNNNFIMIYIARST